MKKPLYQVIIDDILNDIQLGNLKNGDQLPTEHELADRYKVSRITSKRALNDLETLGYVKRIQGKGSFIQKDDINSTHEILFVMPFPNAPNFGNYTQGMLKALTESPYRLHILDNESLHKEQHDFSQYAGVILYPQSSNESMNFIFKLFEGNIPTILLDKEISGVPLTSVTPNNVQGGFIATEHLMKQKCKKIGFVGQKDFFNISSSRERFIGYLKAFEKQDNLKPQEAVYFEPLHHFDLEQFIKFDGIVFENDILAIQVMNQLLSNNVKIPQDIKLVGFDNSQASELVNPSLSSVAQDFESIGFRAMKELLQEIHYDKKKDVKNIKLDVSLVARDSSRKE